MSVCDDNKRGMIGIWMTTKELTFILIKDPAKWI